MKESLLDELAKEHGDAATKVVKQNKNKVYNPAVFTSEVAEELGISEEGAYKALELAPRVNKKEVDGTAIWW